MKILFLDCFSGISGDMFLSALIDAGLDADFLTSQLKLLPLDGYTFTASTMRRNGIKGSQVNIRVHKKQHHHRHLSDIRNIINQSSLPENVKNKALKIFNTLAGAEARVHDVPINEIHFHEVGAIDSILDIVGAAIAIDTLKIDKIYCTPLPLGKGFVECAHGTLPVPAPATAEILKGLPVYMGPAEGELVTPTGAAIVKSLVNHFQYPKMQIKNIGYGFGSKEYGAFNALRVMTGKVLISGDIEIKPGATAGDIFVLECNLDDMNPELLPYIQNKLLQAGAADVYFQNIIMKKGRPGLELKIIHQEADINELVDIVFKETTTLGIRYRKEKRLTIRRKIIKVSTPYGEIGVKSSRGEDNQHLQSAPEYEDCKAAAEKYKVPLKIVYNSAMVEFEKKSKNL